MSNPNSFETKIKTSYDGKGAKQAVEDIKGVEAAAKEAGAVSQKTGDDLSKYNEIIKEANVSAKATGLIFRGFSSLMRGDVRGALNTVRTGFKLLHVTISSNPLTGWMTIITGLVTFGLPSLVRWLFKSKDATKEYAEILEATSKLLAKTSEEADKARFEGLASALKEIADLYEKANAAAQRQLDFQRKMGDAELAEKLADIDAAEEKELEGASSDPTEQARIRAKYAGQRVQAKQANSRATADRELAAAQARADASVENLNRTQSAAESNREETASEKAYRENQETLRKSAQTLGLKTEQEKELDELAELRNKRQTGGMSGRDQDRLRNLETKEPLLLQQQKEGGTYAEDAIKKMTNQAAEIPNLERRSKMFEGDGGRPLAASNADWERMKAAREKTRGEIQESLKKAQAARAFVETNSASGELKTASDAGTKTREAKQKELDAANAKAAEEMEAQNRELAVQQKQRDTLAKQQSSEARKTEKSGNESIAVAEFEEGKKELETALAALEQAEKTKEVFAQIADVKKKILDLQKPGTTLSAADERVREIAKQGVDQEAQKRIAELQKKEAEEAERRRKEREANGGRERDEKALRLANDIDNRTAGSNFSSDKKAREAAAAIREDAKNQVDNPEHMKAVAEAVKGSSRLSSAADSQQARLNAATDTVIKQLIEDGQRAMERIDVLSEQNKRMESNIRNMRR